MTLFQIAFKNISRDKHTYFSYYISSTVTIMLFFLFTAAAMHPDLNQIENGSTLALALAAGNFIIYVFAFLFIGYSSWAFLGSKGKQLGIYTILGMSPKQMKKMLFGENILIGMSALISGLVSGVLFSGLFFKLIRNIFETISFEMYVPVLPILITFALFTGMFLAIGWIIPYVISRRKVLCFLKSDKNYAEHIRVSGVKLLFGSLFLVGTVVLMIPGIGDALGDLFTAAVFFCVIGAVFLLTPQIGAIYSEMRMRSRKHFEGIRLFADLEVSSTMKENEHMMSLNAVFLAMSFLAICALGSMQSNTAADVENIMPFAYTYIERPGNIRAEEDVALLDSILTGEEHIPKAEYEMLIEEFQFGFLKESDFNEILSVKKKAAVQLKRNEVIVLPGNAEQKRKVDTISEEAEKYIKKTGENIDQVRNKNQRVSVSGALYEVYVVRDEVWQALKELRNTELYVETYAGYEDKDWISHLKIADKLEKLLAQDDANYDYTYAFSTLGRYYDTDVLMRKLCTFVGFSISMIFLVASVSIIYFRLYSSLEREKKKYCAMYKLGFSEKEMQQTIRQKIRVLLWIPFTIAIVTMWAGILYMESLVTVSNIPMSFKYSFIFTAAYVVFYHIVIKIYRRKFEPDHFILQEEK